MTDTLRDNLKGQPRTLPLILGSHDLGSDDPAAITGLPEILRELLPLHGGVLLRGLKVSSAEEFEAFIRLISTDMMTYMDRATPRSQVSGSIFTATDFPPEHTIFLHNESSFAQVWPGMIFFCCLKKATAGGETPLADVRRVYSRISPQVREGFERKGVMYMRNFGKPFGLSWQEVFQTEDRSELEEYWDAKNIDWEWKEGGRLRTRQVRPAVLRHSTSGETVWFNQSCAIGERK